MNPEETKNFIAALQGKNYILIRFKTKTNCRHPKEIIIERSEWMSWQERQDNPHYKRAVVDGESGWRMYKRQEAKRFGYI